MDEQTGPLDGQLPLHGVGDRLRMGREAAGMTLTQLSAETRIPECHLALMEKGEWSGLPARTYATGFARTYAKVVGLDDRAIVEDVRAELAASQGNDRGRVQTFEPGDPARVPSRGLALLSGHLWLIELKREYFPAHTGAIAGIERQQFRERHVAAQAHIGIDESAREVRAPGCIQFHGQESNLGCHVAIAETLVKLNAIDHADLGSSATGLIQHIDMLETQIAVAIANVLFADARGEKRGIAHEKLVNVG